MNKHIKYGLPVLLACILFSWLFIYCNWYKNDNLQKNDKPREDFLIDKFLGGIGVKYWIVDIPQASQEVCLFAEDFDTKDRQKIITINTSAQKVMIGLQRQHEGFVLFICEENGNTTSCRVDKSFIKMPLLAFHLDRNLKNGSYLLKGSKTEVKIDFSRLFKGEKGIRLTFDESLKI